MAKTDNLKDFLTDVADAIREKKGTTDLINPQDFSAEIASIKSGGGGVVAASPKAVNFRDYDGTILHSYTKDEFLALTELPPLPTREGLICQEWNWDFTDAVEYVTEYGMLEVGATYITDDGKTRLYITIEKDRQDITLTFSYTGTVTIDWGDGNIFENGATSHHYENEGSYIITIETVAGVIELGSGSSGKSLVGATSGTGYAYCNTLKKVELGSNIKQFKASTFNSCFSLESITIPKGVVLGNNAFNSCFSLKSITLPKGSTKTGNQAFRYCFSLESITLPKSITSMGSSITFDQCFSLRTITIPPGVSVIESQIFQDCRSLARVALPNSLTQIKDSSFAKCYALESITLPSGLVSIGSSVFSDCRSLRSVKAPQNITSIGSSFLSNCMALSSFVIPQGITKISAAMFYFCYSLHSLIIPRGITAIDSNAFYQCSSVAFFDFSTLETVPTLYNPGAFYSIASDCKIVVPDALYDEWIAATNWSSYASKIIKKSEWDTLNA